MTNHTMNMANQTFYHVDDLNTEFLKNLTDKTIDLLEIYVRNPRTSVVSAAYIHLL